MRPLQGVRVLDLTRLLPGAYATLLLADLGADVIKIEDPRGGDGMRHLVPPANVYFERLNRGKRSVTLNLRSPDAAAVLDALIAGSDVLVESFRPSTARRLGVDAVTLRARHPRLICASISGFGQTGPYAERAAHDINYQALAGLLDVARPLQGRARGAESPALRAPALPQLLVGDIGSAHHAALRIVAALVARARTGAGTSIDVAIHDAALDWAMVPSTDDLPRARYNVYETADGQWLALGALEEKFWTGFCERIGVPVTSSVNEVRAVLRTRPRDAWLAIFADADVCLTTVHSRAEVAVDPHVVERRSLEPRGGPAPALGAHTDEMLNGAGIGAAERARLHAAGVI